MQFYGFQHIFNEFSEQKKATKADSHDIGKIRDKFTEIIDMVGIDIDLLRKYKDEKTGKMVSFDNSNRQFCFPETICDFCVDVLKRYTDKDFKKLRKGQYEEVAIDQLDFLIEGFTRYLEDLGYDFNIISTERSKMDKRLHYTVSKHMFQLRQACNELLKDANDYNNSILESLYEDNIYFTWYITEKVKKLRNYIGNVHFNFIDLRSLEVDEFAEEEALNIDNAETIKDMQQTLLINDALKHDKEYKDLLKKRMEILCTENFIKNLKMSYKKVTDQIKAIKEKHEQELFGNKVQDIEPVCKFTPKHPLSVLHDAIKWTDETEQEQIESSERKANITSEQQESQKAELSKIFSQCFDFPAIEQENQKIKKKGIIKFPCCTGEKTDVYEGATGCIVSKCPRCGEIILFNLSDMTAEIYEIPRGHMKLIQ